MKPRREGHTGPWLPDEIDEFLGKWAAEDGRERELPELLSLLASDDDLEAADLQGS